MAHGGDVRVVSYNLLSSGLCEPSHFVHCDPADLHPPTRLARVLKKLKPECDACAVLCLRAGATPQPGPTKISNSCSIPNSC